MSKNHLYIRPNNWITEALKDVKLPIDSIKDITGVDTKSLLILVDDGPANNQYQTFGFYITDWNYSGTLVEELRKVKKQYKISERTISYKGRKDKLKKRAFKDWINVVRNYPGLLYIVGFDTSARQTKEFKRDFEEISEQLSNHGFEAKFETYEKMASAISFFTVLAPYMYAGLNIIWLTDPDSIIDTKQKAIVLNNSVGFMLDELVDFNLGNISCMTKFKEVVEDSEVQEENIKMNNAVEELLSIPDIACSSISASMNLTEEGEILCPDDETADIISELAKFTDIEDFKISERLYCCFGFSIFEIDYDKQGNAFYRHKKMKYTKN